MHRLAQIVSVACVALLAGLAALKARSAAGVDDAIGGPTGEGA